MKFTKHLPYIFLILLGLIPLFDLLHPGLHITHDGQDHVARIANFYQNLKEGIIVPRWAGNLNWGYGHPVLMFLYPMSSYVASLFHFLGFTFVDSVKLVFALAFVVSGIGIYVWLKEFLDDYAAFFGAILYMFAPYRFVDIYVRGAIGEHMAFVFPGFVLYFLLKLSKKYTRVSMIGASISIAGLILSHNAISLMFLGITTLYVLYLLIQTKSKQVVIYSIIAAIFGFGLSAFFWMPAFMEGKFTLRDIVTQNEYKTRFIDLQKFIFSTWNYGGSGLFSVQVGIVQWIVVIAALPVTIYLKTKKNKLWILTGILLVVFMMTLFMMIPASQFLWDRISIIQKFQFPWRFLTVSVFVSAVLGAIVFQYIPKKYKQAVLGIGVIVVLLLNSGYWQAKAYQIKPESFYTSIYLGTTDTGESAPIWSVRFMEKKPKAKIEVIEGSNIKIQEIMRTSTNHIYTINAPEKLRIRENTLYFPGWQILIDNHPVVLQFQDPAHRGLMTFFVGKGQHTIETVFSETKLRWVADAISIASLIGIILIGFFKKLSLWQRSR